MFAPFVRLLLAEKRVEDAIRAENYGLAAQRLKAITERRTSRWRSGWHVERAPDGTPLRMVWATWQEGG
jgi:hypothetical protein